MEEANLSPSTLDQEAFTQDQDFQVVESRLKELMIVMDSAKRGRLLTQGTQPSEGARRNRHAGLGKGG